MADCAPPLPAQRARTVGGVYAELTDSSSDSDDSSSDDDSDSSSSEAGDPAPAKFDSVRKKLRERAAQSNGAQAEAQMASGPRCPVCGSGVQKPDAIYFGEGLPKGAIKKALALSEAAGAFLIVGTSGSVFPACELPKLARLAGARVIEVSPRQTNLSTHADLLLLGTAAVVMPQLVEAVKRSVEAASRRQAEDAQ